MLTNISYYQIFGLPVLVYLGIFGLLLLIAAAVIGNLSLSGKIKIPVTTHKLIAAAGLIIAFTHGLLAVFSLL